MKGLGSRGAGVAQPAVRSHVDTGNATIGDAGNDGPQRFTPEVMCKIVARIVAAKKAGEEFVFMVSVGSTPSINHSLDTTHSDAFRKLAQNRG